MLESFIYIALSVLVVGALAWFSVNARYYQDLVNDNRERCAEAHAGGDDCMGDESWRAER